MQSKCPYCDVPNPEEIDRDRAVICQHCGRLYHITNVRPPAYSRDPLLQERQKTHGDFSRNAEVSQQLKAIFIRYGQDGMRYAHQESLDMIALKLSRILSGQANHKDHWDDIAGYAKLGSEACE